MFIFRRRKARVSEGRKWRPNSRFHRSKMFPYQGIMLHKISFPVLCAQKLRITNQNSLKRLVSLWYETRTWRAKHNGREADVKGNLLPFLKITLVAVTYPSPMPQSPSLSPYPLLLKPNHIWDGNSNGPITSLVLHSCLFDWQGQASLTNYFQSCQWSGTLYYNMIISLKVFLFLVLLENCNLYD